MRNHSADRAQGLPLVVRALGGTAFVAAVVLLLAWVAGGTGPPHQPEAPDRPAGPSAAGAPTDGSFNRAAHSTTDPASIWVIVNKKHPIARDYAPQTVDVDGYQIAAPAAAPLQNLLVDGDARGLGLGITSAFRSYDYQEQVHARLVAAQGKVDADKYSARAGYSEHQTGLAVDLTTSADRSCDLDPCFGQTPAGRWLAREAWHYGFVVRYQPATTAITGYEPEPWHLRYVGRDLATELHRTQIATLEQFFGVPGGGYPGG